MDEIFGYKDERLEVSIADSTMMWIVHYAMNKAQERMKTKTGVIERLNEISKFYELAVMQLEGCLSFVHAETESRFLESKHEDVLTDLREIKGRLQWRLKECDLAISVKDRELTERLENELKLRHALEMKEGELVSLGESHEIETTPPRSRNAENDQIKRNEHGGGDFCELRTSVDQQMLNIRQRLEPQHDMVGEMPHNGIDRKKVEEMGTDIDILKQTMDLAFGKMQSTLLLCEMGPKERQWKLTTERDIMSILIRSFMREFQDNIEAEVRNDEKKVLKCCQEHWTQVMNEVTAMHHELATLIERCPEDSDSSALSSPTKSSALSSPTKSSEVEGSHDKANSYFQNVEEVDKKEKSPKEEENEDGSNYVSKMIKNHESIIRQKNEELNRSKHGVQEKKGSYLKKRKELNNLKEKIHSVTDRLDNLINWNAKVSESLFHKSAIHDKETLSGRKLSEVYETGKVSKDVDTWGSVWEKVNEVTDAGNQVHHEIRVINIEKKYNTLQSSISEDMHGSIDEGMVEELDSKSNNFDLEMLIQEHVYKYYLREVISQWNENIERYMIERKMSDDINLIVFSEGAKDISSNQEFATAKCQGGESEEYGLQYSTSSNQVDEIERTMKEDICMLIFKKTVEEFNKMLVDCNADTIVREDIHQIVFAETLKSFVNISSSATREFRENTIQDNFLDQSQCMIIESLVREDVCMVAFKAMVKEWKLELDNCYMENIIREEIHQVIMVETLKDAFLLCTEATSSVRYNSTLEDNCSNVRLNQVQKDLGKENLTIILLESLLKCFEAEENLMLSAQSEIKEHSKTLDLGSERGDLHEHEIFEDLITGEEQTFSSLTSKVENVLQQLGISKALLRELGTSLGHRLRDSESFHNQMSTYEECQLKLSSSVFLPLLNVSQTFEEFEGMVCQKLEMMTVRLENMKRCLDLVIELGDCLRSKELLYQKAFIRRCKNLQIAEAEVDLLGDQVDALLTLLEKIYVTLHQYAPDLQQYFEVSNLLELIRKELISRAVQAASVAT